MKTMYLDISVPRIVVTRLLSKVWRGAYYAPTAPLHLAELPEMALPAADWVRVRNRMCGICGSDLHQLTVDAGLDVAPLALPAHKRIYLGHEMVGDVIEVGTAVTQFKVGDRVVRWGRADDCLARGRTELCAACARGHRVLCEWASETWEHHPVGGGFGDTFLTPASTLLPVPDGLTDERAIFTEPTAVAIHAAWRKIPDAGDKVLVLGCGPIGFLLLQVLRLVQPHCEITAVAQFPWQAEIARALGADHTFLAGEDGYAAASQLTGGHLYQGRGGNRMLIGGFDVVFDVVGMPGTLRDALRWTRAGGTVVLIGVYLHQMQIDLTPVWHQEINLLGAIGHDVVTWQGESISTFALAMRWLRDGQVQVERLLTHRFALEDYREAFATAVDKRTHHAIKVAFVM
ncbi:MAG: alcohol dehydrogenase catalytic domain-containing protein [Ardenticatenaceae bacterium]|nr:alcohol dehydrogenase catalytic domain-containing protein [Ardenticatenaceae bacterium]